MERARKIRQRKVEGRTKPGEKGLKRTDRERETERARERERR